VPGVKALFQDSLFAFGGSKFAVTAGVNARRPEVHKDFCFPTSRRFYYLKRYIGRAKPFGSRNQSITARRNILEFEASVKVSFDGRHKFVVLLSEKNETCPWNSRLFLGSHLNDTCTLNAAHF
jgi:hypothetical protein